MNVTPAPSQRRKWPFPMRLPVFAAPMFLISGPELVIAACEAGIAGAFPTPNCRTSAELDQWMTTISRGLQEHAERSGARRAGPWVANLVTHSTNSRLAEDLELVRRHRPPIVITALGSPKPAIPIVREYGGLIFADVVNLNLARKAAAAGVDGLACICAGAGGHTGQLSPFAFVSAVREFFDGWIAVGGGIADGAGIAGALAAGADFVYMGTRFLPSKESMAVHDYKQMVVDCGTDDLIVSAAITGTPASWLMPSLERQGVDLAAGVAAARDYDARGDVAKRWRDLWACGQGLQTIHAIEPVAAIVDRLEDEYLSARARFRVSMWGSQ